jgi:hypothetical protein
LNVFAPDRIASGESMAAEDRSTPFGWLDQKIFGLSEKQKQFFETQADERNIHNANEVMIGILEPKLARDSMHMRMLGQIMQFETGAYLGGLFSLPAAPKKPVIIGETMARVQRAASKIPGSKTLDDMPDFASMGMNPDQVTSAMMQYNRKWILQQLRSGRPIFDIGLDPNRSTPSIFYEMEQNMIKNYKKLHPEFRW